MPRPHPPVCVLFDFDGVICDTGPLIFDIDRHAMQRLYGFTPTDEEILQLFGTDGITSTERLLQAHGVTDSVWDYFAKRGGNTPVYAQANLIPSQGIVDLLKDLKTSGIPCAVVSTTQRSDILLALNRMGLFDLFAAVVCREDVANHKPAPDPYLEGLKRLGLNPQDASKAIAFEDSPTGIASAKAAGLWCIAYTGATGKQDITQADESITSFENFKL